jgi:serine/threonine protein kinase
VTGVLGSGGFATVYRTWQVAVGRETAVKVDSRVLHNERDQRRFFREVTAAGRLSGHPNVVDIYDAGTLRDGRPYLVMELCPGGSLHDELSRGGPMSPERVCRIGVGLADALAAAHAAGVLHRDIKPGNILINRYGVVGLSDFGLASIIAASGEQSVSREALTPAYAAPESFRAAEPAPAADIYSLAATLYALMAGRPPRFPAGTKPPSVATILALHGQPVDDIPGVPPPMMAVLRHCLAADPAQRLPSAAALRDSLAALLEQPASDPAAGMPRMPPNLVPPDLVSRNPAPPWSAASLTRPMSHTGMPGHGDAVTSPSAGLSAPTTSVPDLRTHTGTPRQRARPVAVATVGGGLVVVIVTTVIVITRLLAPSTAAPGSGTAGAGGGTTRASTASSSTTQTGTAGALDTFGIATTTSHCPAASTPGAGARCPASPECWDGVVEDVGIITATALPCDKPHTWQTFAIGIMPSDASAFDVNIVQANPIVRAVCSYQVMLRSRTGAARKIPRSQWMIQVAPPDETAYDAGVRTYRCLAEAGGYNGARTSRFAS